MSRSGKTFPEACTAGGRSGRAVHPGPDWLGWSGQLARPAAPLGGGGPGNSDLPGPQLEPAEVTDPWQPGPAQPLPLEGSAAPTPAKAPPATSPRSLGTLKSVQNDLTDVSIDADIVADGSGGTTEADTSFSGGQAWTAPQFTSTGGKIVSFEGKFTWRGTITIQTVYGQGAGPKDVSCYGRGTTDDDVRDRNITLGFHESCHRDDYAAYLRANSLPDPPTITIGMTESDFNTAIANFGKAVKKYFAGMKADSLAKTDEVGYTLSKANRTKKCFVHLVP